MTVHSVYLLIAPNGKKYVGMTKVKPKYRWNNGKGYMQNKELFSDIIKYGWDNFEKKIIESNLTEEQATILERENIKKYNTCDPKLGYNKEEGGKHPRYIAEQTKKKMSKSHIGLYRDENYRKNISISKMGEKNGMYGATDAKNPNASAVIAIDSQGNETRYGAISEACRVLELSKNSFKNISACCRGKRKIAYGYRWRYAE